MLTSCRTLTDHPIVDDTQTAAEREENRGWDERRNGLCGCARGDGRRGQRFGMTLTGSPNRISIPKNNTWYEVFLYVVSLSVLRPVQRF